MLGYRTPRDPAGLALQWDRGVLAVWRVEIYQLTAPQDPTFRARRAVPIKGPREISIRGAREMRREAGAIDEQPMASYGPQVIGCGPMQGHRAADRLGKPRCGCRGTAPRGGPANVLCGEMGLLWARSRLAPPVQDAGRAGVDNAAPGAPARYV